MLIIAGTLTVDPADRDRFIESRRDTVARARAMNGCLEYAFSADAVDPACVRLFERWESQDDVDAWLAAHSTHRPKSNEPDVPVQRMAFLRHEISSTAPVETPSEVASRYR